METQLPEALRRSPAGVLAESILRACVHCGFCNATCPTYQLLGDELDGPRGRIYQIKQVLEGAEPTRMTQLHLDRCLTCRSCETTCPSGVQYGHLLDVGREVVEHKTPRPRRERALRWMLREGLTRPGIFSRALRLARGLAFAMPAPLRAKLGSVHGAGGWPRGTHARKVLLLAGCVQPALLPSIDAATARVLDRFGIQTSIAANSGCCGAIRHHLGDAPGALDEARRNIDAWWPELAAGRREAIVINASGCGAMIRDYAHLLRGDPHYAAKAQLVTAMTRDLSEFLLPQVEKLGTLAATPAAERVAFHSPCTLQHGLGIRGAVESILRAAGAQVLPVQDSHLCCGSAGTYSLLQSEISAALRERKIAALTSSTPQIVLSANVGCIAHLGAGAPVPVRHWIEWLDAKLEHQ